MAGNTQKASHALRKGVPYGPADARLQHALGLALSSLGEDSEAIACFSRSIELDPHYDQPHIVLAHTCKRRGDKTGTLTHLRNAVRMSPTSVLAKRCLAVALIGYSEFTEAIELLCAIVHEDTADAQAWYHLGRAYRESNHTSDAIAAFDRAARLHPGNLSFFLERGLTLPVLYHDVTQIHESRRHYAEVLQAAANTPATTWDDDGASSVHRTNFSLPYQGRDDRSLQSLYGQLVHDLMSAAHPSWRADRPMPSVSRRLRVGFASAYLWNHTVGKLFGGWLTELNRDRFEIFAYHLSERNDHLTADLSVNTTFIQCSRDIGAVARRIASDDLHVLIYPELGMHPATFQLAALRLAPVQCVAWGHPITSGLPTMDYFLSSALMEPEGSDRSYTETLVRLPGLSIHYRRPPTISAPIPRAELGLSDRDVLFLCCQSLPKYLPQYDDVFVEIAARLASARFVFIGNRSGTVTEHFRARVARAFARRGLRHDDYCRILPPQQPADFLALQMSSDVYLDSIGWSGGNTTLEALACGRPIVCLWGQHMRGRHSAAMLARIGLASLVADNLQDYIETAVRWGRHKDLRDEVSHRIVAANDALYEDRDSVKALEDFLTFACSRRSAS